MKTSKLLAAAFLSFASLPLLMAQQVDATAQQSASASAGAAHVNESADASANANASHGHADVSGAADSSLHAHDTGRANAAATSSAEGSANMRPVTGQLEGKLDSKTARPGDQVVLKTSQKMKTADGVEIPKGARLIGHVTEVQAHAKGQSESRMGLEFDRVELKNGQSMGIHSMIESVEPGASAMAASSMENEEALSAPMGGGSVATSSGGVAGGRVGGGGLLGGTANGAAMATGRVGSELGETAGGAARATSNLGASAASNVGRGVGATAGTAGSLASGVRATGIQGVMLSGDAANSASGTLTAANRNIHLDSGTQMVLGIAVAR